MLNTIQYVINLTGLLGERIKKVSITFWLLELVRNIKESRNESMRQHSVPSRVNLNSLEVSPPQS